LGGGGAHLGECGVVWCGVVWCGVVLFVVVHPVLVVASLGVGEAAGEGCAVEFCQ
jgi:hypothetical protein